MIDNENELWNKSFKLKSTESRYIALFVVSGSIKKIFLN